jgi:hypothetical protein
MIVRTAVAILQKPESQKSIKHAVFIQIELNLH